MEMNTLQAAIEERAKKRLKEDYNAALAAIFSSRLMRDLNVNTLPLVYKGKTQSLVALLTYSESVAMMDIKAYWLPRYIQEETAKFISEVEDLRDRVDELGEQVDDLNLGA